MTVSESNPLLQRSSLFCELPPFADIDDSQVLPAFAEAMARHRAEIDAIVANPEPPTFVNTIEAMERAGADLDRTAAYFFNLAGTDATEQRMSIEAEIAPKLSAHFDSIRMRTDLWQRISGIEDVFGAANEAEAARLLDKVRRDFRRAGADLAPAAKEELSAINSRLSELATTFGENLLKDTSARAVAIDDLEELAGLSDDTLAGLAAYAKKANSQATWLIPLDLPSTPALLADLDNAETRAKLYQASLARASEGEFDNSAIVLEIARLRARRASLLGYASHADYVIAEETAGDAAAARTLIADLAPAAIANAQGEYKRVSDLADGGEVTGADWPYWQRRREAEEFAVAADELKNYFELDRVIKDGVFYAAEKLYGITISPRDDLQGYAPGTRVWEISQGEQTIGLIITDYFSRPSKRGGAWMSSFRDQSALLGRKPVVVNVMNIAETDPGSPVLLTMDEVTTAFHEFGHALHGLLSEVTYPTFSGTNVPRDFVEFPSQINENWALEPSILSNYARHVDTGEPIPAELVAAVRRSRTAGEGFATVEYLAACAIDLAWHGLSEAEAEQVTDVDAFEQEALAALGLDVPHLAPRYRSRYFNHIFAGGYSAGYYSYLWAEVLDADGFGWFEENGGADPAAGAHFRSEILSRGGAIDFTAAYRAFRGRDKDIQPLLHRRGLAGTHTAAEDVAHAGQHSD